MNSPTKQHGFLMIIALILIVVVGFLGIAILYIFFGSSISTLNTSQSSKAFYLAEAGLQQATRALLTPNLTNRTSCAALSISNTLAAGAYAVTPAGPYSVSSAATLSSAISATASTIPASSITAYQSAGRILIDREKINYTAISGNNFVGAIRGVDDSIASSHATGAPIGQYQCKLSSQGGVPNLAPTSVILSGQRTVTQAIQLQEGWAVGNNLSGPTTWNATHWNNPTEKQWTQQTISLSSPQQLNAVSMLSPVDVWVVGNNVSALHYNGSSWSNITSGLPASEDLLAVSGISSAEAWASSSQGEIWKWSGGTTWTQSFSGTKALNGLSMLDTDGNGTADTGWAVGATQTAIFYNGSTWTSTSTGITTTLNSVSTLSATDAWAAGNSGRVFHWTGGSSWAAAAPVSATLNSISMLRYNSLDIGWAVGNNSTAIYYNGSTWSSQTTGLPGALTFNGVVTISPNEAWLVASNGRIYEWNGSTWTLIFTAGAALNGVDIIHPNQAPDSAWFEDYH